MGDLLYLDASALVKLVLAERETGRLLALLQDWPQRVSSEISVVEVIRAARRASNDPKIHRRAQKVVAGTHLIRIDQPLLASASELTPTTMRSLDAIHLASALSLGKDIGAMVVYDRSLASAARASGLAVLSPGS